jgi:hypothetical protein
VNVTARRSGEPEGDDRNPMVQLPRLTIKLDAIDPRSNGLTRSSSQSNQPQTQRKTRHDPAHDNARPGPSKSKAFYLAALAPPAYSLMGQMDHDGAKIARFGWIRSDGSEKID